MKPRAAPSRTQRPSAVHLAADDRDEPVRELLFPEGLGHPGLDSVLCQQCRHKSSVDEDVLVALVVAPPRAVLASEKGCDFADKEVRPREAEARDDRPVFGDPARVRIVAPQLAVAQIAEIEGEDTAWPQGVCGGGQRTVDRRLVGEIAE